MRPEFCPLLPSHSHPPAPCVALSSRRRARAFDFHHRHLSFCAAVILSPQQIKAPILFIIAPCALFYLPLTRPIFSPISSRALFLCLPALPLRAPPAVPFGSPWSIPPPLMDGRKAIVVHCPCYLLFFYQRHISPVPASFAIILYDNCYCWLSAPLSPRTRAPCHRFFRFFFLPTRARRQTEPPVFVGEAPSPFPLPTRPCLSPPPRRPTSCKETSLCVLCFSPLLAIAILGLLSRAAKRNAAGRSGSRARAARLGDALRRAARESAAIAAACCTAFVCACSAVIRAHSCL